jgi:hypothetical protein
MGVERTSEEVLLIDRGSLYPALQRLERAGLNRRARFYRLTRFGACVWRRKPANGKDGTGYGPQPEGAR